MSISDGMLVKRKFKILKLMSCQVSIIKTITLLGEPNQPRKKILYFAYCYEPGLEQTF